MSFTHLLAMYCAYLELQLPRESRRCGVLYMSGVQFAEFHVLGTPQILCVSVHGLS